MTVYTRTESAPRQTSRGRYYVALLIAGISLVSYFFNTSDNPITGKSQRVGMSTSEEVAMGLQASPALAEQFGGLDSDSAARERVDRIGVMLVERNLKGEVPYNFDFHLLADPSVINAFALPGGQVFITRALYDRLKTDGQLAGVLAHEIGHVIERHSAQQFAKGQLATGITTAVGVASYDPNNPRSAQAAQIAAVVAQVVTMRFGRQAELESDGWGVKLAAGAGYNPLAMIEVMNILEQSSNNRQPEFLSTHPDPGNRREHLQRVVQNEFPDGLPEGLHN